DHFGGGARLAQEGVLGARIDAGLPGSSAERRFQSEGFSQLRRRGCSCASGCGGPGADRESGRSTCVAGHSPWDEGFARGERTTVQLRVENSREFSFAV